MIGRWLSAALVAATVGAGVPAVARADDTDVAVRAIVQEGLAIGMANSVLFTQLFTVLAADPNLDVKTGRCLHAFGTDLIVRERTKTGPTSGTSTVDFFFDESCTARYIAADVASSYTRSDDGDPVATEGTSTYYDRAGRQIGKLALTSDWRVRNGGENSIFLATGFGRFRPANGAATVDLALSCDLSDALDVILSEEGKAKAPCQGGVAQRFASQRRFIGAVEPLTLAIDEDADRLTFAGGASRTVTAGKPIRLEPGAAVPQLQFGSPVAPFGSTAAKGTTGEFAMLPDVPTGWTLRDDAHGLVFRVELVDSVTRNLKGSVRGVDGGRPLATFALDQSGTGTIEYRGGMAVAVTSWLLAD